MKSRFFFGRGFRMGQGWWSSTGTVRAPRRKGGASETPIVLKKLAQGIPFMSSPRYERKRLGSFIRQPIYERFDSSGTASSLRGTPTNTKLRRKLLGLLPHSMGFGSQFPSIGASCICIRDIEITCLQMLQEIA